MFDWMTSPEGWIALVTLTVLEIVLGVDNIIFISILAGKLPRDQQDKARRLGPAAGDADAHRPAVLDRVGHAAHAAAVRRVRSRRVRAATWS